MTKSKKQSSKKDETNKAPFKDRWNGFWKQVGKTIVDAYQLLVTIAQFMAAYALFFQDSIVLKSIAGVLAFNAVLTAVNKYTNSK